MIVLKKSYEWKENTRTAQGIASSCVWREHSQGVCRVVRDTAAKRGWVGMRRISAHIIRSVMWKGKAKTVWRLDKKGQDDQDCCQSRLQVVRVKARS